MTKENTFVGVSASMHLYPYNSAYRRIAELLDAKLAATYRIQRINSDNVATGNKWCVDQDREITPRLGFEFCDKVPLPERDSVVDLMHLSDGTTIKLNVEVRMGKILKTRYWSVQLDHPRLNPNGTHSNYIFSCERPAAGEKWNNLWEFK